MTVGGSIKGDEGKTALSSFGKRMFRRYGGLASVIFLLGFVVYHLGWGAKVGIHGAPTEQNFGDTQIRFRDVTSEIGPDFPWTKFKESTSDFVNAGVIFRQPAVLAVGDLNADSVAKLDNTISSRRIF
jgi:hypothetical protein